MTISTNLNSSTSMQNSSLKKDEMESNNKIVLNEQTSKETKNEPKMNSYSSFLGTNLDIKV